MPPWFAVHASRHNHQPVFSRMVPAMALLNNTVQTTLRGTFMSLNSSVQQFALSLRAMAAAYHRRTAKTANPKLPVGQNFWYILQHRRHLDSKYV